MHVPGTDPSSPVPTEAELNEASNYYNGVPSEERKRKDIAFLLSTKIPYDYRAVLDRQNIDHRLVKSNRPSGAAMDHAYSSGRVSGFQEAVQGLFGYFFLQHAAEVLDAAVATITERTAKEG
jgi:hypothetical protein